MPVDSEGDQKTIGTIRTCTDGEGVSSLGHDKSTAPLRNKSITSKDAVSDLKDASGDLTHNVTHDKSGEVTLHEEDATNKDSYS
jgi:hypothetical protein